jgi:hypothetical protein
VAEQERLEQRVAPPGRGAARRPGQTGHLSSVSPATVVHNLTMRRITV